MKEIEQLEKAIVALEAMRADLGDTVVDSAVESIKIRLAALRSYQETGEKQRKLVSILFMDIVGSSKLGLHLDPENLMEVIDTALQKLSLPVYYHGGRVTRFMGDGFLAVFGAPKAREDDTRNAVAAGLDILKAAENYSFELKNKREIFDFKVRVGVNTGRVALGGVTEGLDTMMGRTVNLAARMESAAPENSLLITHSTYRHIRGAFVVDRQPPIDVKGEQRPVVTYLVYGANPHATSIDGRGIEGITTPFVGRHRELELLANAYSTSSKTKRTQSITVFSGPGIGKTRLVNVFKESIGDLDSDLQVFEGHGTQRNIEDPFSLFRDVFSRYLDIRESDDLETLRSKIEQGIGENMDGARLEYSHYIGALLGFNFTHSPYLKAIINDPKQLRQIGEYYLKQFIKNLIGDTPTLIILDDLHWGDDTSLDFINKFSQDNTDLPLLLINLTRPELFERKPDWGRLAIDPDHRFQRIELSPLTEEEECELVNQILTHAEDTDPKLCQMILENAEGNPYYIEEFFNILIDDKVIQTGDPDTGWVIDTSRLEAIRIPPTLTALLQARLDRLSSGEKRAIQQASVAGLYFWDALISVFQGLQSPPTDLLHRLADKDLIQPVEISKFKHTMEYRFKHALLHEVTYESVLLKKRIEYHAVVADWLSDQTEKIGRQAEFSAEIAIHYRNAEDSNKASAWYLRAADRAKSIAAPEEARQYYEAALDLNPVENLDRRWQILLGQDEVTGILGESEARQAIDRELVDLAMQLGNDQHLARAYKRKGWYESLLGNFQTAIDDLNQAIKYARAAEDIRMETLVLGLLVVCQTRSGNLDDAFRSAQRALALSSVLNDEEIRARTLTNVAIYYTESGDITSAARLLEEQVQINRQIGNKGGEAIGLGNLGYDYVQLGLYDKGREALEHSIALAESIGLQLESAYQKLNLSLALLWSGDPDRCKSLLESTIPDLEEIGDLFGTGAGFNYLGLCLENSGDLEAAMEAYADSDRLFSEIGANSYALDPTAGLVRCLVYLNREGQAGAFIDRIWLNIEGQHCAGMEFPVLAFLTCAEYHLSLDDLESADKVLRCGYEELMRHANQISDTDWRRSYLENVAAHRRLIELWERLSQQPN